jgi:hypothetical protein
MFAGYAAYRNLTVAFVAWVLIDMLAALKAFKGNTISGIPDLPVFLNSPITQPCRGSGCFLGELP